MGLKKSRFKVNKLGITIPTAYAQINRISVDLEGNCIASFKIQTSRESMSFPAIDTVNIQTIVDKNLPLYKQVYEYAKRTVFTTWNDDIVENEEIIDENIEEPIDDVMNEPI